MPPFIKIKKLLDKCFPELAHARRFRRKQAKNQAWVKTAHSYSQVGQDAWVYGEVFNEKSHGFFVDLGAHDGILLSNTYILEKRYNWSGICIEANPLTYQSLVANRDCICVNKCVDHHHGKVTFALNDTNGGIIAEDCDNDSDERSTETVELDALPLIELLREHNAPKNIDYLSVDIEGAEDRALLNFPFDQYTFRCITIERPSAQLRSRLQQEGYLLIKEIPDLDCFYIHSSFKDNHWQNLFKHHEKKWQLIQK